MKCADAGGMFLSASAITNQLASPRALGRVDERSHLRGVVGD
jgi:hypothetical protein